MNRLAAEEPQIADHESSRRILFSHTSCGTRMLPPRQRVIA